MTRKVGNRMSFRRDERGVAMVTVLLVAAVLTVTASAATFMTIQEFRAGSDDRRGTTALAYAEAGLDHFVLLARGGNWTWQQLVRSGCDSVPLATLNGTIGNGTYNVIVRPQPSCPVGFPSPRNEFRVSITSTGRHPTATRVVQQIANLRPKGLPIGTYALNDVVVSGAGSGPTFDGQSLIAGGNVSGRDVLAFVGNDKWYKKGQFFGTSVPDPDAFIPTAVHAGGNITCQGPKDCGGDGIEHTSDDTDRNCTANPMGTKFQSTWDESGQGAASTASLPSCGHPGGDAPDSRFTRDDARRLAPTPNLFDEDYRALKATAQNSGLYCLYEADGDGTCTSPAFPAGTPAPSVWTKTELAKMGLPNNFTAYFDYPKDLLPDPFLASNTVDWRADVSSCSNDPLANRSVTMIIPNGSVAASSGGVITGGVIAPAGQALLTGGAKLHGSLITDRLVLKGTSSFLLDDCWLNNMPALYLDVIPLQWRELDRPQP